MIRVIYFWQQEKKCICRFNSKETEAGLFARFLHQSEIAAIGKRFQRQARKKKEREKKKYFLKFY